LNKKKRKKRERIGKEKCVMIGSKRKKELNDRRN
jgi:hypothetical protein